MGYQVNGKGENYFPLLREDETLLENLCKLSRKNELKYSWQIFSVCGTNFTNLNDYGVGPKICICFSRFKKGPNLVCLYGWTDTLIDLNCSFMARSSSEIKPLDIEGRFMSFVRMYYPSIFPSKHTVKLLVICNQYSLVLAINY